MAKSKTPITDTILVRVKADANTDFVKFGKVKIGKGEFVEVDKSIQNHRGYAMMELQFTNK